MIDRLIYDNTSFALERAASGASQRQGVLSNNIANVNTPGYVRKDFEFAEALSDAISSSGFESSAERSGIQDASRSVVMDGSTPLRMDGSNVDVDTEMASLAKNTIEYNAFIRLLNDKIGLMRTAIQGR